jgi:hypothetical protein
MFAQGFVENRLDGALHLLTPLAAALKGLQCAVERSDLPEPPAFGAEGYKKRRSRPTSKSPQVLTYYVI